MFTAGFQFVAFQTVWGGSSAPSTGGGLPYIYNPNFQAKKQEIKKNKTELQKVQSVISEYERRRALAEESLRIADESEHQRLLSIQNELIEEINRLLIVKAEMMARLKRSEEQLILMMAMRRKRFRAFSLDNLKDLSYV